MCGIVGELRRSADLGQDELAERMRALGSTFAHRGPDGDGVWTDEQRGIALGHRRLAVIDTSEFGHQPMVSANGRYVITFNGEIYNHRELAIGLAERGVRLRGHSDTEILVEQIALVGLSAALDRIDGMFAFGVWDREREVLTLARDRIGEKPLYYGTMRSGSHVFASTVTAIAAHPEFDRSIDRSALASYLRYNAVPSPHSIYEGVRKLPPASLVELTRAGVGEPRAYWSVSETLATASTFEGSSAEAVDEFSRLMERSVTERLVADVPVGAFLSGGLDSTTVVAFAQRVSNSPVKTFTIGSPVGDFDESAAAAKIADHLGCDHTELIVGDAEALETVPRLSRYYDEPFGDSSQIPTLIVSELARRHVTVSLSGDGGDELFGGYNRYVSLPSLRSRSAVLPAPARRVFGRTLAAVPPNVWNRAAALVPANRRPQQVGLKVAKSLKVIAAESDELAFRRVVSHWDDPERLVPGSTEPLSAFDLAMARHRSGDLESRMMAVDIESYLPDDILVKVDRAAMAVSLEGRVPFLSRDLVEFALSLPTDLKIRDGRSKWVVREALNSMVPRELMDRPKSGFGIPLDQWLRGPLRTWGEELLNGSQLRAYVDVDFVRRSWALHQSGRVDLGYPLWDVLMFAAWLEESA